MDRVGAQAPWAHGAVGGRGHVAWAWPGTWSLGWLESGVRGCPAGVGQRDREGLGGQEARGRGSRGPGRRRPGKGSGGGRRCSVVVQRV